MSKYIIRCSYEDLINFKFRKTPDFKNEMYFSGCFIRYRNFEIIVNPFGSILIVFDNKIYIRMIVFLQTVVDIFSNIKYSGIKLKNINSKNRKYNVSCGRKNGHFLLKLVNIKTGKTKEFLFDSLISVYDRCGFVDIMIEYNGEKILKEIKRHHLQSNRLFIHDIIKSYDDCCDKIQTRINLIRIFNSINENFNMLIENPNIFKISCSSDLTRFLCEFI